MRGQLLFNDLFSETLPIPAKQEGKGRNSDLNAARDTLLLHRYYYYGKFHNTIKYEVVIKWLSEQFFLSERRIQDVIYQSAIELRQLRQEQPTILQLRKRWPHIVW